jgi:hypothetical protein
MDSLTLMDQVCLHGRMKNHCPDRQTLPAPTVRKAMLAWGMRKISKKCQYTE